MAMSLRPHIVGPPCRDVGQEREQLLPASARPLTLSRAVLATPTENRGWVKSYRREGPRYHALRPTFDL